MDGDNPVNQSRLEVITHSQHKRRENVHARATIGFGFTSDWLKKWRENTEPITEWSRYKTKVIRSLLSTLNWKPLYEKLWLISCVSPKAILKTEAKVFPQYRRTSNNKIAHNGMNQTAQFSDLHSITLREICTELYLVTTSSLGICLPIHLIFW